MRRLGRPRTTVGLLIDWVSTPYHAGILNGVQQFCEYNDLNLVCFVTGRIGSTLESEQCRNLLTELASEHTVDGLVVCASSLQNFSGYAHMRNFLARYEHLPMVTLHEAFPGIPSVAVDNEAGMRLLLDHLTEDHGYRRFAFVRGLEGNRDFDERFEAWKVYLASHGLPLDAELVVSGDYKPKAGADAVHHLAAYRNEFDVLVCANDAMALGALEAARSLDWQLPVVGFDDVQMAEPFGLTTVRQSVARQAASAVGLLVKILGNEDTQFQQLERPKLVARRSCGCAAHQNHEPEPADLRQLAGSVNEYDLEDLQDVGELLFSTLDQEAELRVVTQDFPKLGIDACCISLYDDAADPLLTAHAVAAYDGVKVFPIDKQGIQFPTRSIVPSGIFDSQKRRSLMVQALFRGTEQIGLAVFSMSTRKWRVYEFLRRELSSALKGASLLRSVMEYADDLERQVKARTAELEEANSHLKLEILERSRVEAELARREEHYRELALLLPTMVVETDLGLRISFVNRAGADMFELSDQGGRAPLLSFVHEDDREYVEEQLRTILENKRATSGEFRLLSETGRTTSILFEANAIIKGGALRGIRLSGINVGSMFSAAIKPEEVLYKHYHFSPRVKEVLELMLQGYSSKQIAEQLEISENTVKAHVRAIYLEVGVENRAGLFKVLREYQVHHFGYQSYVFSMLSSLIRN